MPAGGEEHPNARLTWERVRAIRASSDTDVALAARYGVSRPAIRLVRSGRTWREDGMVTRVSPRSPWRLQEGTCPCGSRRRGLTPDGLFAPGSVCPSCGRVEPAPSGS